MRFSTGGYLLSETGKSIWRNKLTSFLSCATTALSLFLLGVAFLVSLNIKFTYAVVQDQMEIQAYLAKETTLDQAQAVYEAIKKLPGVSHAEYVSKEEALEWLKQRFQDNASVLAGLGDDNPLPASVRLKVDDVAETSSVVAEIKKMPQVEDVIYQEGTSRQLASLGIATQYVSLGGMLIVGLVAIMVIGNSIRLTIDARRHEIGIMKLVGATDEFIIGPFLLEGMILGMLGGLIGEGLVVGLYVWVVRGVQNVVPFLPVMELTMPVALDMLGIMLVTGMAVGTIGSVLALRKHLRV